MHTGFNTALKLLWLLCHGFATVKLIQHLLCTFPFCASIGLFHATISLCQLYDPKCLLLSKMKMFSMSLHIAGEAHLVTSGLVLYFGDMLACTISKVRAALSYRYSMLWLKFPAGLAF